MPPFSWWELFTLGVFLLDLSWNMFLRRSTKVNGETNRKMRFRNGMCLKRKKLSREKMIVLFRLSLNDLFLFPTEGMIGVFAYLVTCWPDCGKKLKFLLSEVIIGRKKKWNLLRWLVIIDWVFNLPIAVSPLVWYFFVCGPPFLLLVSVSAPHSLSFCRKK